jgi:hypothetical protein
MHVLIKIIVDKRFFIVYGGFFQITQRDIENTVNRETSGDFERGLLSIGK